MNEEAKAPLAAAQGQELVTLAAGVWTVDGMTRFMPGAHVQGRCTILGLQSGGLLIYSPIRLSTEMWSVIDGLGKVEALFAPNLYHHMFLAEAQRRYPQARTYAPAALSKKVSGLHVDVALAARELKGLPAELSAVAIEGAPSFDEIVVLHQASQSLVVGDYFFNVHKYRGWLAKPLLRFTDTLEKPTQSKLWRRVTKDRALMQRSAAAVQDLAFERVIMCHGEPMLGARDWVTSSLSWLAE